MTADAPKRALKGSTAVSTSKTSRVAPPLFSQTEKAFQSSVIRYATLMGWRCHHQYDARRSAPGVPDLLLVRARHPKPRVVWAELKSDRGRVTDAQRTWITELRACGQEAYIWRPSMWQDVERILK